MGIEKRKHARRNIALNVNAVTPAGATIPCELTDISEGGARLAGHQAAQLPDEFMLELSQTLRRWSRIAWRTETAIGVQFIATAWDRARGGKKHPVVATCSKTGKSITTGLSVADQHDLRRLSPILRFSHCPYCNVVHGWAASEARIADR